MNSCGSNDASLDSSWLLSVQPSNLLIRQNEGAQQQFVVNAAAAAVFHAACCQPLTCDIRRLR